MGWEGKGFFWHFAILMDNSIRVQQQNSWQNYMTFIKMGFEGMIDCKGSIHNLAGVKVRTEKNHLWIGFKPVTFVTLVQWSLGMGHSLKYGLLDMCGTEQYSFSAVLVINRASILAILSLNRIGDVFCTLVLIPYVVLKKPLFHHNYQKDHKQKPCKNYI